MYKRQEYGSKNPGTTNVLRVAGKKVAALTLLGDVLKGVVAVGITALIARLVTPPVNYLILQLSAVAVVLGHMYPIFFKFKGGKGIATGIGLLLVVNWQVAVIMIAFAVLVIAVTRYVSLGSLSGSLLMLVLFAFLGESNVVEGPIWSYMLMLSLIHI